MSVMVDRIAEAIWEIEQAEGEPGSSPDHPIWKLMACAVFKVIREPTEAMIDRLAHGIGVDEETPAIWRAVIDVALADESRL